MRTVLLSLTLLIALALPAEAVIQTGPDAAAKVPLQAGACLPSVGALNSAGRVIPIDKLPARATDNQQIASAMDLLGSPSDVAASSLRLPIRPSEGFAGTREYADFLAHRGQFSAGVSFSRVCAATTFPRT